MVTYSKHTLYTFEEIILRQLFQSTRDEIGSGIVIIMRNRKFVKYNSI